jgi:hypothetical protein
MTKLNSKFSVSKHGLAQAMVQRLHDDRGSTIPIYAFGLLLLATASAATITVNRRSLVETRTQGAADAASLAATTVYADLKNEQSENKLSDTAIEEKARAAAKSMFKLNAGSSGVNITDNDIKFSTKKDGNNRVIGISTRITPQVSVKSFMLKVLKESANLKSDVSSESQVGIGSGTNAYVSGERNLEVVLVLDVTGSMSGTIAGDKKTKIQGLREAVKSFVNGIYGSEIGNNDAPPSNIKFSIIPYSNSVNVGKLLTSADLTIPADLSSWVSRTDSKGWYGCIVERSTPAGLVALDPVGSVYVRPNALDVRDEAQPVTSEKWTPYYNDPTEHYQQFLGNVTDNKGKTKSATRGIRWADNWFRPSDYGSARAPLRLVRNSVSEYWRDDTAEPAVSEARDQQGNVVPRLTATSADTGNGSPNANCVAPALPLASGYTKKQLGDYVDALKTGGWTHSNLGMAWANRMLSPWAPLTGASNYGDTKTDKLIVLMTDGYITAGDIYANTNDSTSLSATKLLTSSSVQNPAGYFRVDDGTNYDGTQMSWAGYYYAYGKSYLNRLVGNQANGKPYSNASGHILAHQQRLLMACKIARTPESYAGTNPATKVYTILFGFSLPAGARNIYEECATVPGYALTADNSSKLTEAFTKIASDSNLQLTE